MPKTVEVLRWYVDIARVLLKAHRVLGMHRALLGALLRIQRVLYSTLQGTVCLQILLICCDAF